MSTKFKITGVISNLETKSGTSKKGDWVSASFIITEEGEYPNAVKLSYMESGDRIKWANEFIGKANGATATVEFSLRMREYNGKQYQDASVWKIVELTPSTEPSDLPF